MKKIVLVLILILFNSFTTNISFNKVFCINDSISFQKTQDTVVDVNGKNGTFIGDSHTSNHNNGWQVIVCKNTGLRMNNLSVSGKTTGWMLDMAKQNLHKGIDYCFIYGGANDMYTSSITPLKAVKNIQQIVNICNRYGIIPVVLTGFDAKLTNTPNANYIPKYVKFQKMLIDSICNSKVIDARVTVKTDCWDGLCHMAPSGHKKIGWKVIHDMKFKLKQ